MIPAQLKFFGCVVVAVVGVSIYLVICSRSQMVDSIILPFSLQPSIATREVQVRLWQELILEYCRSQRIYTISLEQDFPLFSNPAIQSEKLFCFLFFLILCYPVPSNFKIDRFVSTDSSSAGYQHYFVYHHVYELILAIERLIMLLC